MVLGQLLQHLLRGGRHAGLGRLLARPHPQPVEQHVAQLDRRVDVERRARQLVDLRGEGRDLLLHVAAHLGQEREVHLDPRPLHVRQHLDQRQLHRAVDVGEPLLVEAPRQRLGQAEGEVGLLGRGLRGRHQRRRARAFDERGGRARALAQELHREVVHRVVAPPGVQQVRRHQRVEGQASRSRGPAGRAGCGRVCRARRASGPRCPPSAAGAARGSPRPAAAPGFSSGECAIGTYTASPARQARPTPSGLARIGSRASRTKQSATCLAARASATAATISSRVVSTRCVVRLGPASGANSLARAMNSSSVNSAWAAARSGGRRRTASRSSVTGRSVRRVTRRLDRSAESRVRLQALAIGGALDLVGVGEDLLDASRTRGPGRARPSRRCRARRGRCRPSPPPGPARPPRAPAARRTSPPPSCGRTSPTPRPRGRGSGRGRRR